MENTAATFNIILKRLETATSRLEQIAFPSSKSSTPLEVSTGQMPPLIEAYQAFLDGPAQSFFSHSKKVNHLVEEQAKLVYDALAETKNLIQVGTEYQKPSDIKVELELFEPIQTRINSAISLRDSQRASPFFNHLTTVSDGVMALSWPLISPAPGSYVSESKAASQFYGNRVVKEFKEKDPVQVEWVNLFVILLTELEAYVRKFHTTGLSWNSKGSALKDASSVNLSSGSAKTAAGPSDDLPPPPPPPAPLMTESSSAASSSKSDMSQLFSNLNKGEQITSGLKKVDRSQMTHKNPELRSSGMVKADVAKGSTGTTNLGGATKSMSKSQLMPVFELDGNKWRVENQEGNQNIVIDQTSLKQVIYIYNCRQCLIQVKGKINAITMDHCSKTAVVVENVVSSIDVVQCSSGQIQIMGSCPTLMLDKTDGFQVYYSRQCMKETQLLTAKCSEINVLLPGKTDSDDYIEKPVPEQFRTFMNEAGELVTTTVTHAG